MVWLYFLVYVTQRFVECMFQIDDSHIYRMIPRLEPILAYEIVFKKWKNYRKKSWKPVLFMPRSNPLKALKDARKL
ncbi:hypothetical protein HCUR_01295 [Holospora curviuscula]|uniref:Uncharacterized protein n=1 Tax=Holospora curviuscula TaxID=1082868 RepID=A0A2S5R7H6_9PROT|nr:hypothetical protein HCUR_01295 [Holospora curviuscula]